MKTSYFVPQQVPQHVLAEYPAFVEFIKAYYEWYDQQSLGSLQDLLDVDSTIDSFIQYFKKELDEAGVLTNIDSRFYLKNIKQLYRAKGSKASFQFLFKLLYNQESEVEHPWDYTFKPSSGKWKQDISTIIRVTKGDGNLLGGNYIHVVDINGKQYNTYVHDVVKRASDIFEIFIDRIRCGRVRMAQVSTLDGDIQGEIVLSTARALVEKPGEGFEIGQIFRASSIGGQGTVIKVKAVDANGGIKSVEIIAFGYGYRADFNVVLVPTQDIKPTPNLSLVRKDAGDEVTGNYSYITDDLPSAYQEAGEVIQHDYSSLTGNKTGVGTDFFEDGTYVGNLLGGFLVDEKAATQKEPASIRFEVGCILSYPGYYVDSTNLLDDLIYIHDSFYYQVYSYVTSTENSVDVYGDVLKKILHPAGTIHFGRLKLSNEAVLTIQAFSSLNLLTAPDVWIDYIQTSLSLLAFDIGRNPLTDAVVSDQAVYAAQYYRDMLELNSDPAEYQVITSSQLFKTFTPNIIRNTITADEGGVETTTVTDDEGNVIQLRILDLSGNIVFGIFPGMEFNDPVINSTNIKFDIDFNWLTSNVTSSSTFNYSWIIKHVEGIETDIVNMSTAMISDTGVVENITGTGPWQAVITGMNTTDGLTIGSSIIATDDAGSLGTGGIYRVSQIISDTSVSFTATGGTEPVAGAIANIKKNLHSVVLTPAIVPVYLVSALDNILMGPEKVIDQDIITVTDSTRPIFESTKNPEHLAVTSNGVNIYKDPVYVNTNETWVATGYLENEYFTTN